MYFFSNGNLYYAKSKGALVCEFVEIQPTEGELLEMFVNDLREMDLKVESDYSEVLEYITDEWAEAALETFKRECAEAGVEYTELVSKTYLYSHHGVMLKVTLDREGEIYQIFMQKKDSLQWKVLRANHAKAQVMLNHAEQVMRGEPFGHYLRVAQ